MKVEITLNDAKRGIELLFSEKLSKELANRLREFGFKKGFQAPVKWYAPQHPAFITYAGALKEALHKGRAFLSVHIQPSYTATEENIDHNKFSYVTISYKSTKKEQESYVLFDSYKAVATAIAKRYGKNKYRAAFKGVDVSPRNYKRKARALLKEGKVIAEILPEESGKDYFTNKQGVYTPELAGDRYVVIDIPIPKTAKYDAKIATVLGEDKLYRSSFSAHKQFGDYGGISSPISENDQTFESWPLAIQGAAIKLIQHMITDLNSSDSILNNETKKKGLISKALDAVRDYLSTEYHIELDEPKTKKENDKPSPKKPKETPEPTSKKKNDSLEQFNGSDFETIEKTQEISPLYHGTCIPFKRFEKQYLGRKTGDIPSHFGYHFTPNKKLAATIFANDPHNDSYEDCRYIEVGLKVTKTLKTTEETLVKNVLLWGIEQGIITERTDELLDLLKLPYVSDDEKKEKSLLRTIESDEWYTNGKQNIDYEILAIRYLNEVLKPQEFDSILYQNAIEWSNENRYDWIVFDVAQISYKKTKYVGKTKANQAKKEPASKATETNKAVAVDIQSRGGNIPNVLVPSDSKEPFISGSLLIKNAKKIQEASPNLLTINDNELSKATAIELFELSQMPHPTEYGLKVKRGTLLKEWQTRGAEVFEELGFPTDLDYPYVNIHGGYTSVYPLSKILTSKGIDWWAVVEHYRPIADMQKAIDILDSQLRVLEDARLETINPKTNKPKAKEKEKYRKLTWDINGLSESKEQINSYIKANPNKTKSQPTAQAEPKNTKQATPKNDYLDRVVANMHEKYAKGERPTKGYIQKLAIELNVPNMGMMWEAAELSWLLWYKQIYREPTSFEERLENMIYFWNKLQPTYAYSDSSKEIYKQYSTPCPIGAIIAQYTEMDAAGWIFEPSAGNGLLLVGADPRKTHVNEIDHSRMASLKFQGFNKYTNFNAAQPFPEEMAKNYDVMVTNPPFARWEDDKFDKERIIRKYFNSHVGLEKHIRLEHLMAGLALHTMKDTGKAAIIIMGHVYFGEDGFIAKYRPFFNWLYRNYHVNDVINMNSFKLYNKQGAIEKTMLILIGGRKSEPKGVAPTQKEAAHLYDMVNSFSELWTRVKPFTAYTLDKIIQQLEIAIAA